MPRLLQTSQRAPGSATRTSTAWERALALHPDQALARYICNGLRCGFRVGFRHSSPLKSAPANMLSANQHPEVISEYLHKERSLGRMLGPFSEAELGRLPPLHINRFGVVPKGHNTGKYRLITDLSFPPGSSVNDGIDPALCSMVYTTVDEVAALVMQLGRGSLLAKVDIESAYRLLPVHPQDRVLQAMKWGGQVYIDPMLPFGLRSAPKILTRWRTHCVGIFNSQESITCSTTWMITSWLHHQIPQFANIGWTSC